MKIAQKAHAAIIGGLAVILLAGCVPIASSTAASGAAQTPASTSVSTKQKEPAPQFVQAVKVTDPDTIVVALVHSNGTFGRTFVLHENTIVAPAKGDCGYDKALAFAEQTLVGNRWWGKYDTVTNGIYVDSHGAHYGYLASTNSSYGQIMVTAGMAVTPTNDGTSHLSGFQQTAKSNKTGLWAICPSFGA